MMDGAYSTEDLRDLLGISPRTIHFWVQSGLLEGPGKGRGAHRYRDEHLAKLFLIRKLQAEGRTLAEIRGIVNGKSAVTLRQIAREAKAAGRESPQASGVDHQDARTAFRKAPASSQPGGYWERIPLAPSVELHVQHPLSLASMEMTHKLVAFARRLQKEPTR